MCLPVRGEKPVVAFVMTACVISVSTAVGNVVKETYDSVGDKKVGGFFIYLVLVFVTALIVHSVLMFMCSYGGGMLANPENKLVPSLRYYMTGKEFETKPNLEMEKRLTERIM